MLLDKGADVNAKGVRGGTPLHIACRYGSSEIVELLLARGADVDEEDIDRQTPLMMACYAGSSSLAIVIFFFPINVSE